MNLRKVLDIYSYETFLHSLQQSTGHFRSKDQSCILDRMGPLKILSSRILLNTLPTFFCEELLIAFAAPHIHLKEYLVQKDFLTNKPFIKDTRSFFASASFSASRRALRNKPIRSPQSLTGLLCMCFSARSFSTAFLDF